MATGDYGILKVEPLSRTSNKEWLELSSAVQFCGFQSISRSLPEVTVGMMIHALSISNSADPPMEFHMHTLIA
jgi:hypothetical protein